jgi:hypothetical protein
MRNECGTERREPSGAVQEPERPEQLDNLIRRG